MLARISFVTILTLYSVVRDCDILQIGMKFGSGRIDVCTQRINHSVAMYNS